MINGEQRRHPTFRIGHQSTTSFLFPSFVRRGWGGRTRFDPTCLPPKKGREPYPTSFVPLRNETPYKGEASDEDQVPRVQDPRATESSHTGTRG